MTLAFISHPTCLLHEMGETHPEAPGRLTAINKALTDTGIIKSLTQFLAPTATKEQLARVHSADYIEEIFRLAPQTGQVWLDPDTAMNPYTLAAALHAAGAVVYAVDLLMSKQATAAFCNVRPPGHHALHNQAMGFCFFNNIAVGVAHALAHYHLKRIAIVDFDMHNGNGTIDIFHDDPRVLFFSTYQYPFYPNVGTETSNDHIINIPLPFGAGGAEFRTAIQQQVLEPLAQFSPEIIFISAGFDAHREDPLAGLNLTEEDFAWITTEICTIANNCAAGRVISTLEGGYNLNALGRSVAAHLKAMLDQQFPS